MTPLATALLRTATPDAGMGPDELVDLLPDLVRAGWFLVGFLLVLVVGWYVVEPVVSRGIRRRNRNNPTIQEAISRYVRLFVLLVALFVGAGAAGFGQVLQNSALVIAAGTLAIGVAGQTVIGSLVSGLALVADPEFNGGWRSSPTPSSTSETTSSGQTGRTKSGRSRSGSRASTRPTANS